MDKKKLKLSRNNKIIAGVCGGIAEYFNVDPTLIRILFAILFFVSVGVPMAAIYIICWAVMPMGTD